MSGPTPQEILLAVALVFGIALACQLIAPRLRIPALVLLLPSGFVLGWVAPQLRFDTILGQAFPIAVNLMVAVILFHGGMQLSSLSLRDQDKPVVRRLVWVGGAITWLAGALAAHFLLGFGWPLAALLGAILVVSGPTVVTPILDSMQLRPRLRSILMWEGTMLDPIGAILAVVVFQGVRASNAPSFFDAFMLFAGGVVVAFIAAALGVVMLLIGGRLVRGNATLGTQVLVVSVLVAAALADVVAQDSGLLTALLMGMAAPAVAKKFGASLSDAMPFFDTIVAIGIGVLFVVIAALVPSTDVLSILLPTLIMAVVLIVVVRPIVAAVCTWRSDVPGNERMFIGVMDPRGIVAAATASSIGAALIAAKFPDAQKLLPAAFIVIAVTVTFYSLASRPMARILKVNSASGESS
jgi:NhaP-type Na+/H+ or K+/H+ antiporter